MNLALLGALPARIFGVMSNDVLLAIPLFIFMGVMLERSRIAEDLLETMARLFGALPGGLGFLGDLCRRAARRGQGRRRRHHGDHGADRAADHAAPRLRQGAGGGHGGGDRDLGADFSAGDRAGAARRSAQQFLPGRAIGAGQFRAADGVGRRPVRRRHHSRPRPGAAVSALSDRRRDLLSAKVAGDCARPRRAARLRVGAPADRGSRSRRSR